MQDDVIKVARLIAEMRQKEIGADWGGFDDYTEEGKQNALNEARAAMAATLELAAKKVEAYSTILVVRDDIAADIRAMRGPTDDR